MACCWRGGVRLIHEPHPCLLRAPGPACGRPRPLPADASNRRLLRSRRFSTHPLRQIRKTPLSGRFSYLAERVGFEPTLRHNRKPDFESGAFDHSATSPCTRRRGRGDPVADSPPVEVGRIGPRMIRGRPRPDKVAGRGIDQGPLARSRATRNPTRALRVSPRAAMRNAERTCAGSLPQEPPRTTCRSQPGLTQAELSRGARM
jgi:hypothetical protein